MNHRCSDVLPGQRSLAQSQVRIQPPLGVFVFEEGLNCLAMRHVADRTVTGSEFSPLGIFRTSGARCDDVTAGTSQAGSRRSTRAKIPFLP